MNERRAAILFLTPALAVIFLFFLLPVCASLLLSVTDFDIYALADIHNIRLIGLRNYSDLLGNSLFWKALGNTLYFTAVGGPLTVILSLATALLVNAKSARLKPPPRRRCRRKDRARPARRCRSMRTRRC